MHPFTRSISASRSVRSSARASSEQFPAWHPPSFGRRDTTLGGENLRPEVFFPLHAAVVVARNRGEAIAPAWLPTNFVLVGMTASDGIKLPTVRGDSTLARD